MPPRKRAGSGKRGQQDETGQDGPVRRPRLERNPDADPVRLHREYVQRRVGGGDLPTPQAYERAVDQWHRLGGAVRGPAGEVHPETDEQAIRRLRHDERAAEAPAAEAPADERTQVEYEGPLPATDVGDNRPYEKGAGR